VGEALQKIGYDDSTVGKDFELYGPTNYSMREIADLVDKEILKTRRHINLPKSVMKPVLHYLNKLLWWPIRSPDSLEQESLDQFVDKNALTFKDLDIEPSELANLTFHYLQEYRNPSFYDLPPATLREQREEKKYLHVIDDQ